MTEAITSKSNVPALDKGLDILEFMADQTEPQSIYDISRALGRTRGELYRMLNRLIERGYLSRVGDQDRFILGDKLFRLAVNTSTTQHLISSSAPLMTRIVGESGFSSLLSVRSGDYAITVFNINSNDRISMSSPIGSRKVLWETAPGIAMLGEMPDYEIDPIIDALDGKAGRELKQRIKDQRQQGYTIFEQQEISPVCEVAVPFRGNQQTIDAAISTVLFRDQINQAPAVGLKMAEIAQGS